MYLQSASASTPRPGRLYLWERTPILIGAGVGMLFGNEKFCAREFVNNGASLTRH